MDDSFDSSDGFGSGLVHFHLPIPSVKASVIALPDIPGIGKLSLKHSGDRLMKFHLGWGVGMTIPGQKFIAAAGLNFLEKEEPGDSAGPFFIRGGSRFVFILQTYQ